MSRESILLDPGKILEWAEKGLLKASLFLEGKVERVLNHYHKKDKRKTLNKRAEKKRREDTIELTKKQDAKLELVGHRMDITHRLRELGNRKQESTQNIEQEH